jgi:plasmid stabilization system protein ParE
MQVRWTTAAANDLESIANYLFEKTPQNAPAGGPAFVRSGDL